MIEEVERLIEKHIPQSPTDNHSDHRPCQYICPIILCQRESTILLETRDQIPCNEKPTEIHESIPMHRKIEEYESDSPRWEETDHGHSITNEVGHLRSPAIVSS